MLNESTVRPTIGHVPMLWLITPQIIGYTLARYIPAISGTTPLAISILLLLCAYALCSRAPQLLSWSPFYFIGATLLAMSYLNWREPTANERNIIKALPIREAEIILRIDRSYPASKLKRFSLHTTVVDTPAHLSYLIGHRLLANGYLNPDSNQNSVWVRGAKLTVRGILKPITPTSEAGDSSFHMLLLRSGYHYMLEHTRLVDEIAPASSFQKWCIRAREQLQSIARLGAEHPREITLSDVQIAMLLGIKSVLSNDQKLAFRNSGTMHLFAISGLHVGIIATVLYALLAIARVPAVPRCLLALGVLWVYVQITGAAPSAVRAFIMTLCFWAALGFRRKRSTLSALLTSAFAVLVYDPLQLFGVGFQLSYAVVGGLLLYGQPLLTAVQERWKLFRFRTETSLSWFELGLRSFWHWLLGLGSICIAAFIFSTPLTIAYFQIFAPGSIVLNMLLAPLATLCIIGGCLSFACGIVHLTALSTIFNHAAWLIISGMECCLELALHLNWIFATVKWLSLPAAIACECLLFATVLTLHFFKKISGIGFLLAPPAILIATICWAGLASQF